MGGKERPSIEEITDYLCLAGDHITLSGYGKDPIPWVVGIAFRSDLRECGNTPNEALYSLYLLVKSLEKKREEENGN